MNKLFFSIIVPTYNRANYLKITIQSVLAQTYEHFELVIIDDGSTDETEQIVKTFSDPRIVYLKIRNSERGAARNKGVIVSKGDYVTFLDSDDILYTNYFSNASLKLRVLNFPIFFHQSYEIKNRSGKIFSYSKMQKETSFKFLVKGNPLSCLGVFVKRNQALEFPFSEDRNLSGSEDWELWLRLYSHFGIKVDSVQTACLFIHDDRSVVNVNEQQLLLRKNLALNYAFNDDKVKEVFGQSRSKMEAYCDSYISLHLILTRQNIKGLHYLYSSIKTYPLTIFEKRFLAIIKNILINIFHIKK